jgi:hypothetical protein
MITALVRPMAFEYETMPWSSSIDRSRELVQGCLRPRLPR